LNPLTELKSFASWMMAELRDCTHRACSSQARFSGRSGDSADWRRWVGGWPGENDLWLNPTRNPIRLLGRWKGRIGSGRDEPCPIPEQTWTVVAPTL